MSFTRAATWFLFDNGSLRAESTLSLRRVAVGLAARTGQRVEAVSLLHSSNVPAEDLAGVPARLLEPALNHYFAGNPRGEAGLLPLFFGPSGALTDYVPARLASIGGKFPEARFRMASWLVDPRAGDLRMAQILADRVREVARAEKWSNPKVILVDHGSPQPAVAAVRNHLGEQLRTLLGSEVSALGVASMERRDGPEYSFNEPLLASLLRTPPFDHGNVVVALQFLSPGRHAGAGGDIATICDEAQLDRPGLITRMSEPMAGDPRLLDVLADRMAAAIAIDPRPKS